MISLPTLILGLAVLEGCGLPAPLPTPETSEASEEATELVRELGLMGTTATIELSAVDRSTAVAASEAAVRTLESVEQRLSTWRETSELSRLNALPIGASTSLSGELAEALQLARECATRTEGAFDPTVAPLVQAWGLRSGGRSPTDRELSEARSRVGADRLEGIGQQPRKRMAFEIEEGAFAKGFALDRALAAAREAGARSATLDLGGQVSRWFADEEAAEWISVAHPEQRDRPAVEILLGAGSLATSGNNERGIVVDGERIGHLLDPRTGRPAPDFGSLSVLAPTGLEADCLSTGLYVLGPEAALAFAERNPGIEVVIIEPTAGDPRIRASSGATLRPPEVVLASHLR